MSGQSGSSQSSLARPDHKSGNVVMHALSAARKGEERR
jgi:hypothetical protein